MLVNTQPIEKQDLRPDGSLEVFKIFFTIQGEGPYAGHRAVFIRLAGCNLQCPGCDTDYTSTRKRMTVDELTAAVGRLLSEVPTNRNLIDLVVITGGEPFRQNLVPLCAALFNMGCGIQIETNGTLYQELPHYVEIVCSPKTGAIHRRLGPRLAALKYVVNADQVAEDDGLPVYALRHSASPRLARPPHDFTGDVYIQPMDVQAPEENRRHEKAAVDSAMKHGHILCLQVHKHLNLE